MKKSIIVLSTVALLLLGCQNSSYKISGNVAESSNLNGKWIYLTERVDREWKNLDSIQIENNSFQFTGMADSTIIAYLMFTTEQGESFIESFVLESGNIKVNLDTTYVMSIKGTSNNDVLGIYKSEKRRFMQEMDSVYKATMASHATNMEVAMDSIQAVMTKLNIESSEVDKRYSNEYVNTIVGTYIFENSFYNFDIEEKDALFNKMNATTKSGKRISELIKATAREKKTAVGETFVDFTLVDTEGNTKKLSDYVGKTDYLLVDFWASWCGPCIRTFPELTAFYAKNRSAKFDILGVSLDREKEDWLAAIKKYNLVWNHISDLKYWESEGAKTYAVNSIPATVIIDRNGKIVARNIDLNKLQELIDQPIEP